MVAASEIGRAFWFDLLRKSQIFEKSAKKYVGSAMAR
jgi:hypothetical protein